MTRLRVAPIVEGHGEVIAVRKLLERVWYELLGNTGLEVLAPVRIHRSKVLRPEKRTPGKCKTKTIIVSEELNRPIQLAALKLEAAQPPADMQLILLLIDADEACPKEIAPRLSTAMTAAAGKMSVCAVLATVEYETWFVAAASSLADYLTLSLRDDDIKHPETDRRGKSWIKKKFKGSYSETIDQVRLTARMDLNVARQRCPSFDKLCRELESFALPATES